MSEIQTKIKVTDLTTIDISSCISCYFYQGGRYTCIFENFDFYLEVKKVFGSCVSGEKVYILKFNN